MFGARQGWKIKSNREAGMDRADILACHSGTKKAYIIEIKYFLTAKNLEADAKAALEQINTQLYDQYFDDMKTQSIKHYGIAFCKNKIIADHTPMSYGLGGFLFKLLKININWFKFRQIRSKPTKILHMTKPRKSHNFGAFCTFSVEFISLRTAVRGELP
ncbi:MAG: PD-(D/E)XK nuclease domain-containing protein [Clostridia bacterium]|nr:PD-(D/E)XK nuclease domain-containing protein [Clostridia bacterium]